MSVGQIHCQAADGATGAPSGNRPGHAACANNDLEFTKTIITGDETWVYGYDPESKFQSLQWKHLESARPKKAQVRSNVKVMLACFFDFRGIVHYKYAPEGQTIYKEYYLEVLRRLRDAARRKWPDIWTGKNWQLHHDNAPTHSTHEIKGFLSKNNTALVREPSYSPDLAPCDFWLFRKLKITLREMRFQSRADITEKTMELRSIPEEEVKRCFQKWQRRWEKCLHLQGEYFEGE